MKLFIIPRPDQYSEDGQGSGGIWRVIQAQGRWLPEFGVEIVDDPTKADVINTHAGMLIDIDTPLVVTNHGAYWTGDIEWPHGFWLENTAVIEALRRAHAVIVPSEWVAYPMRRDMRISPYVIPHGIDIDAVPEQHEDYVLWAKPRVDIVSDPRPMNEVAQRLSLIHI